MTTDDKSFYYKKALSELLILRESKAEKMADSILNNNEEKMVSYLHKIDAIDEAIDKTKFAISELELQEDHD